MAFRRALVVSGALALVAAMSAPSYAQEKKKLSKDEMAEYEAIHAVVDAVAAGKQPAPADAKLTFRSHFLKSGDDVYVPYVVELEPGKLTSTPLVMYIRAVAKNPVAPAAAAAGRGGREGRQGGRGGPGRVGGGAPTGATAFAFEDVAFVTPAADNTVQRALELTPGDYDVYIALSEKPSKDKKAPAAKVTVLNQPLTVPDLLSSLTTSSVILAKGLEPADKQLNGQEQLEQPFTISGYKITPAFSSTFPKSGELLWVFYIYNEGMAGSGKPDLTVEYNFFRAAEEKAFTNLQPSAYNSTNLPAEFNVAAGHQVFVGQGVPLTTFAPGDYKVEIKVTDKTNSQSITRTLPFTVTP
jgi:hypothetical protein